MAQSAPEPRKELALQSIGSLTKKPVSTPEPSTSPTPSETASSGRSENTSAAPTQHGRSSENGKSPQGFGSPATPPRSSLPALAKAIAADNPTATDKLVLASLTQLLGSAPKSLVTTRIDPAYGYETEETGFLMPTMSEESRQQAIALVEKSLTPTTQNNCFGMLGELKLLTVPRAEQANDLEAQLRLYTRMLQGYPADVVTHVLRSQSRLSKWWPAWAELHERLEMHTKRRRRILEALRHPQPRTGPAERLKTPSTPSEIVQASSRANEQQRKSNEKPFTDDDITERKEQFLRQCAEANF